MKRTTFRGNLKKSTKKIKEKKKLTKREERARGMKDRRKPPGRRKTWDKFGCGGPPFPKYQLDRTSA